MSRSTLSYRFCPSIPSRKSPFCRRSLTAAPTSPKHAGKNAGRGLIPNRIDISERPAIVVRKTRLGDWEGDTVVSAGRKGGLLTLVERKTKLTKIAKLPRATARATQKAAVRRLKPIADFVHTITFDNVRIPAIADRCSD
jgi:IS30 family transposase